MIRGELGPHHPAVVLIVLLTILPGCRARAGGVGPEECRSASGTLQPAVTADGVAGEYRLTLVGDGTEGKAVTGQLWLEPYEGELRRRTRPDGSPDSTTVYAAYGATDVDLTAVGALQVGSTMSRDPTRPGVAVLERHTAAGGKPATQITLRLGSDANRRDQLRFDGGYTALYVREISSKRLAGDWASGAGRSQTRGRFCATRVGK